MTLSEANLSMEDLEDASHNVPEAALEDLVAWLGGGIDSDRIVEEIKSRARERPACVYDCPSPEALSSPARAAVGPASTSWQFSCTDAS